MKLLHLVAVFILATLFSCNYTRPKNSQQPETPKALQDKSGESFLSKRSYNDDLVESLYNELSDKTPELKALENSIDKLREDKADSLESFNKYKEKTNSYYNSANNHITSIKDSILRDKIKQLIDNSLLKYNSKIILHNNLLSTINTKEITLSDLHNALKLIKTLTLIEKYQSDNLPPLKSLQNVNKEYDKTIIKADSLVQN